MTGARVVAAALTVLAVACAVMAVVCLAAGVWLWGVVCDALADES